MVKRRLRLRKTNFKSTNTKFTEDDLLEVLNKTSSPDTKARDNCRFRAARFTTNHSKNQSTYFFKYSRNRIHTDLTVVHYALTFFKFTDFNTAKGKLK